jgi:LDH2 family malate/lactate/ureidoglycolate dehydrogenase
MNPLAEAVADLTVWDKQADHAVTTLVDKGAVTVMDFNGLAPSLKIKSIHDTLAERARHFGLAAAGFRNSSGVITLNIRTGTISNMPLPTCAGSCATRSRPMGLAGWTSREIGAMQS